MAKRRSPLSGLLWVVAVVAALLVIAEVLTLTGVFSWRSLFSSAEITSSAAPLEGTLEVHYIDVGNADCILLIQGEKTMLIDAGERGDADEILDYLRQEGVQRLDLVIATHAHADHIGSMDRIIKEMPVGQFLMAFMPEGEEPTSAVYTRMLEALADKKIEVTEVLPGDVYSFGAAKVHILGPVNESNDCNAMSVVARVDYGKHRFLFTGDAEEAAEMDILQTGADLKADVLKVGHHGSRTGTCAPFLEAVKPEYAVITCGEGNSYGHPHKPILSALEKAKVKLLRSDLNGNITFVSDGVALLYSCERSVD
ncbi:MAG: MBL fold metallo-hydrolase [Ruminococcaceae bacterium]|nr:MBL fold metallo-hydrolase [Oscillospiraceae bacterium]